MKRLQQIFFTLFLFVLCPVVVVPFARLSWAEEVNPYQELQQLTDVMAIIRRNYVDEVPLKTLVDGAIRGMLASLDPHSSFLAPEDYKEMQTDMSGEFIGLGLDVTIRDEELVVIAPLEGSPAEKAGIIAGDRVVRIDTRNTRDIENVMDALRLLRGVKGSSVTLTIMREGFESPKEFTLQRDIIKIISVHSRSLEPGYGYLRIAQFQATTAAEVARELTQLHQESPAGLNGLILDLRNNSGGLLDQAVNVANFFLEKGLIVYTEGREPGSQLQYSAQQRGTEPYYPLIILINNGSASAAEIVAGALQDHGRALLLGTKSFGKGSVQTILPLRDDYGLRLTTARYFTPLGTSIQALGITPDIVVAARQGKLVRSDHFSEKDLPHHIAATGNQEPLKKSIGLKKVETGEEDNQLQYALDILKGRHILQSVKKGPG
ncbi:MAG: peptidase S41 [Deltaproteobacteria bacterium HGW-Deltaproteobacteria-4]|nr:MAG: peptidase S41 [Deltaproteobacteria bacterium HGW-Deltaproteobacteria-4]